MRTILRFIIVYVIIYLGVTYFNLNISILKTSIYVFSGLTIYRILFK